MRASSTAGVGVAGFIAGYPLVGIPFVAIGVLGLLSAFRAQSYKGLQSSVGTVLASTLVSGTNESGTYDEYTTARILWDHGGQQELTLGVRARPGDRFVSFRSKSGEWLANGNLTTGDISGVTVKAYLGDVLVMMVSYPFVLVIIGLFFMIMMGRDNNKRADVQIAALRAEMARIKADQPTVELVAT